MAELSLYSLEQNKLNKTQTAVASEKIINSSGTFTIKKSVPSDAKFTDTIYTHPTSHPASMITQSSSARFVTDAEKTEWSAKWDYSEDTIKSVKVNSAKDADTVNGKTVAVNVPSGAKFTDTVTTINGKSGVITKADIEALGITSTVSWSDITGKPSFAPSNAQKNSDITKAEIEAKLTGSISSHTHNYLPLSGGTLTGNLTIKSGSSLIHGSKTVISSDGKVFNAVYNDLAEYYENSNKEELTPGDVLVWNGTSVEKAKKHQDNRVVGVYSDTFGFCLGGEEKENMNDNLGKFIPVGLSGRVFVKVSGDIKVGDLLCSSQIPGVATKSNEYIPGTIIGKALQDHNGNNINRIQMQIMNI